MHSPVASPSTFPYGTFAVQPELREHYMLVAPRLASRYPLPDELPHHHPFLEGLCGISPFPDALPPWWTLCVKSCTEHNSCMAPLLSEITCQEFRSGCVNEQHWRTYRKDHKGVCPHRQHGKACQLPSSPKLMPLISDTCWDTLFCERGAADTPPQMDLLISTSPRAFLHMSNGNGWTSCMALRWGDNRHQVPGNFYDTSAALALVVPHGARFEEKNVVIARTTLRMLKNIHTQEELVVIGRTYHNNETVMHLLLDRLGQIFEARQMRWGCVCGSNSEYELTSQERGIRRVALGRMQVRSEDIWFPSSWSRPYMDGAIDWSEEGDVWGEEGTWDYLKGIVTQLG